MHDPPTSISLLQRLRRQDQQAWDRLLHLYQPLVASWCRSSGIRAADLDDLCQEVFQGVLTNLPGFRRDRAGDTFRGWLRGISRNKMMDYFRRRKNRPDGQGGSDAQWRFEQVPEPTFEIPEDTDDEVTSLYFRALELVKEEFEDRTWQAFWRTAVDGLTAPEVAEELTMTPASVRQAKSRVLRRLKEEVGDLVE